MVIKSEYLKALKEAVVVPQKSLERLKDTTRNFSQDSQ
jgi:hypothetical protein